MTPVLRTLRVGLEICEDVDSQITIGEAVPLIASHRRAGTHLLGEFIRKHYGFNWLKSHDFPERLPIKKHPSFYVVRNPFEVIYSTYVWWSGGGAFNPLVESVLADISFAEFLTGKAGVKLGYSLQPCEDRDNLAVTRGMFYDPIQYWANHFYSYINVAEIIAYEDLVMNREKVILQLKRHLGSPQSDIPLLPMPPVGMSPSIEPIGYSLPKWPSWAMDKVINLIDDVMMVKVGRGSIIKWSTGK